MKALESCSGMRRAIVEICQRLTHAHARMHGEALVTLLCSRSQELCGPGFLKANRINMFIPGVSDPPVIQFLGILLL